MAGIYTMTPYETNSIKDMLIKNVNCITVLGENATADLKLLMLLWSVQTMWGKIAQYSIPQYHGSLCY